MLVFAWRGVQLSFSIFKHILNLAFKSQDSDITRAVGQTEKNNKTQQREDGLKNMRAKKKLNEKCVSLSEKLISTKSRCGLNSETTDLWNLGIFPTNSSSTTTGLALPRGSASIQLPRSSEAHSLGDSWTFTFYEASFGLCLESATVGQYTQDYSSPGDGNVVKNLCLVS